MSAHASTRARAASRLGRVAVVSQFYEEKATLIVCSPNGGTYRLRRLLEMEIVFDGKIPILKCDSEDTWRDNFSKYDVRW